jgi:hypothetical protein
MKGRTEAALIALSIFFIFMFFSFYQIFMVRFIFITYLREVEYRKKNIKHTLIIYIYDLDKIFLDSKMQSDENK